MGQAPRSTERISSFSMLLYTSRMSVYKSAFGYSGLRGHLPLGGESAVWERSCYYRDTGRGLQIMYTVTLLLLLLGRIAVLPYVRRCGLLLQTE